MTARTLRIGSRGSRLALRQTEHVVEALRRLHPGLELQVCVVRTEGDRRPRVPLSRIGGQGVFVKELESRLLRGEIDLAVHSLKDVPTDIRDGLTLAAIPGRENPRDALVSRDGTRLTDLPAGARVGTGSARRAVQGQALRPDLRFVDIRGNVDTRLRRVEEGQVDAVILAAAALVRLGCLDRAAEVLEPDLMLPAVGQGALAVEAPAGDAELCKTLFALDHRQTRLEVEAERAFLRRLGGGCRLPTGALANVQGETLHIRAFLSDEEGGRIFRDELSGPAEDADVLGARLAEQLLAQRAEALAARDSR